MVLACIDIGSNTTRLLVATPRDGGLRELCQQRAFTRIGRALRDDGRIGARKIEEVAEVVATQARTAEQLGARALKAVATAAIREAANRDDLVAAVRSRCGVDVDVLTDGQEARLAFVGATRALTEPVTDAVAVIDVGGGSSELAIGTIDGGMTWSASLRLGSGTLTDAYVRSDPPGARELHAIRQHVGGAFEGLAIPPAGLAVAVGGSATSLRRLVGALLEPETLERGLRVLAGSPGAEVARTYELDPERVKLLPAGILLLEETSTRMGLPLQIARGGLREGIILEMIGSATAHDA
jgi:exopolyphosphatase/guanosine-5'-triphosphate,3'-diphosphate pyrophosphatase